MDVVIPLGKGSVWEDNELRYCLRSLEMHCKDLGHVVIVGERPEWLQNILHIPYSDLEKKEINIWNKVRQACLHPEVSENFLFTNDDHFYLRAFQCEGYPNYCRGDMVEKSYNPERPYQYITEQTMNALQSHSLPTIYFDIHRPMIFNKQAFLDCYELFRPQFELGQEMIMKSCYGNFNRLQGIRVKDIKIGGKYHKIIRDKLKNADMFSIYNSLVGPELSEFFSCKFKNKSKFEV